MKHARTCVLLAACYGFQRAAAAGDDHHDHAHDHGDHGSFEWAGIFETPESNYLWTAQKVDGSYVDPSMKIVALPATTLTQQGLSDLEAQGKEAMELTCTQVQAGGTITPANNTCYDLQFQATAWQSLFNVDASAVSGIAFFTAHVPTEFEATAHYLKDSIGTDIEPLGELPVKAEEETPMDAGPFAAAFLVNLVTFIGVLLMFGPLRRMMEKPVFSAMLFAFAAGALLACAFFLLLFESTHLIAVGWKTEVDIVWRWGAMILAGMVVPPVVETIISLLTLTRGQGESPPAEDAKQEAETGPELEGLDSAQKFRAKARLLGAVMIGDFFHNLCDGFFIGAAFQVCGNAFGWSVATGTILHELPQELADFVILTGPVVSMSSLKALAFNFLSGLSVLLGCLIIYLTKVDDSLVGLILAFGGGVYLHVGATDCLPKMYDPKLTLGQRICAFLSFAVGAVCIGLILIGHEHCIAEGGAHDHGSGHDGHAH